MNSVLFIDKPPGITSFDVIRRLRRQLGIKKMGHAGTLDPLATGLLIIGVGKSTKALTHYIGLQKEYEVLIEFGKTSTTYDADGIITEAALVESMTISRTQFEKMLNLFIGDIRQHPPAFSALKIKGKPAYTLARRGEKVALPARTVHVESIELLEWNWPLVKLRIRCSKGTYIRSLAHDMGQKLDCGGYVKELRRTAIGAIRVEDALQLVPCL